MSVPPFSSLPCSISTMPLETVALGDEAAEASYAEPQAALTKYFYIYNKLYTQYVIRSVVH